MVGFFKKSCIDGQHWDDLGSLHIFATIHDVSFYLSFAQFLIANSILERSIYLKNRFNQSLFGLTRQPFNCRVEDPEIKLLKTIESNNKVVIIKVDIKMQNVKFTKSQE